jgi:hypothetical protein
MKVQREQEDRARMEANQEHASNKRKVVAFGLFLSSATLGTIVLTNR